ncbi:hypothetical protein JTB14_030490 [Gonioctena quinquepunctata]|nr:hypothetical protein JTB14_030490 [Gonioctena quinquepunctata]
MAVSYLGVWLDTKLTFAEPINRTAIKIGKTVAALSRLTPNVGGQRSSERMILLSMSHAQLLYAAPTWHSVIKNHELVAKLTGIPRKMTIRICCAYRTILAERKRA